MKSSLECKKCGLLRSTVLATGKNCLKGSEHDFGDHGISFPKSPTTWEERVDNFLKENSMDLSIFGTWLPKELKILVAQEIKLAKEEVVRSILEKSGPVYHNDYPTIHNYVPVEAIEKYTKENNLTI